MKSRRTFLKNVLLALPLVPALAKVSSRAITAPQAPKPQEGSWGKGGIDWQPLLASTSTRVERDPNMPNLYRISYSGVGARIELTQKQEEWEL